MKRIAWFLALVLVPSSTPRLLAVGYGTERDIPYRDAPEAALPEMHRRRLDPYRPTGADGFATEEWFPGGGLGAVGSPRADRTPMPSRASSRPGHNPIRCPRRTRHHGRSSRNTLPPGWNAP
jgi:hypothetical protein